jgi:hypothetical protein
MNPMADKPVTEKQLIRTIQKNNLAIYSHMEKLLKQQKVAIVDDILTYSRNNFATKAELNEVKEAIKHLPTKKDFFDRMDKLAGEYQNFSTDAPNLTSQVSAHEDRLVSIETHLGLSPA